MSSVRQAVVTIAVILALFVAGATALIWPQLHQKPQTDLTDQVVGTVVGRALRPRTGMPARDYDIRYQYEAGGHHYEATALSVDGELSGSTITVCVDPTHPEQNAPLVPGSGAKCGDADLGKWTSTASQID